MNIPDNILISLISVFVGSIIGAIIPFILHFLYDIVKQKNFNKNLITVLDHYKSKIDGLEFFSYDVSKYNQLKDKLYLFYDIIMKSNDQKTITHYLKIIDSLVEVENSTDVKSAIIDFKKLN